MEQTIIRTDVERKVEQQPIYDPERAFQPKHLCPQQSVWAASQILRVLRDR